MLVGLPSTRQILLGDEIVQVNDEDVSRKQLEYILNVIREAERPVEITFQRSMDSRAPALNECFIEQRESAGERTTRTGKIMQEAMMAYPKILAAANARASSSNKSSDKEIDVSDSRYKALTRAFAQIDADILRTSARRLNGPAKRGGKLAGVTISSNAISSNSKGLMESMVSAALEGGIPKLPIDGDTGSTTEAREESQEEVRGGTPLTVSSL